MLRYVPKKSDAQTSVSSGDYASTENIDSIVIWVRPSGKEGIRRASTKCWVCSAFSVSTITRYSALSSLT